MYPMGFGFDSTMLILIPAVLLSLWAQSRVSSTFAQYSGVYAHGGVTADQVARMLLTRFGLGSMPINRIAGSLTDNYNPADRTLNLSESVYNSRSIASIGVAAHEVGHAIQH
ncbi:MAG: zinc metallopeptidase, partial [Synergistaceae bacterium]|nr:zinc metallopeptidase [Synergistaceae bacterium]